MRPSVLPRVWSPRVWSLSVTLVVALVTLAFMLANTGGRVVLPLDDAYIYLQYAHQNAHGEFFRYNDGDPATSGATSVLYALLLTPFALVFKGGGLAAVAFALGGLFFFLTLRSVSALAEEWLSPEARLPAILMVALSGPFIWGAFSGMEIALVAYLAIQAVRSIGRWTREPRDGGADRSIMIWLTLFALSRPEAAVVVGVFIFGVGVARRTIPGAALLVPLAGAAVPFLFNLLLTGHVGSTALASKAAPYLPGTTLTTWLLTATEFFLRNLKGLFDSGDTAFTGWPNAYTSLVTFAAPLTLLFAVLGVGPRAAREWMTRTPSVGIASLWFVIGSFVIWAAFVPINLHWSRYAIPYVPLIAVWVLAGVWRVSQRLSASVDDTSVRAGLLAFFIGTGAVGAVFFVAAYGWNAREIRDQHVAMAEWIEENVPAGAPLATNDVGVLRYYGRRPVTDLHGLTTRDFAAAKQVGTGAVFESVERIPIAIRPRYWAVIPHWFDPELFKILQPVRVQTLNQASISGSPLVLYRTDWTSVGSADSPMRQTLATVQGKRLADRLDVADLVSEREHGYTASLRPGGHASPLGVFRDSESNRPLVDGARRITDHETFELGVTAGRAAVLIVRAIGPLRAQLSLPEGTTLPVRAEPIDGPESWTETAIPIPRSAITDDILRLTIEARDGGLQEGGYLPAHYWIYQ